MKKLLLFFGLLILSTSDSFSQLYQGKYLKLKHRYSQTDTTSEEYLQKYGNITNLNVSILDNYEHENLKIFQLASKIKSLSIHSNSIKSLSGLEHLTELQTLSISRNNIIDFNALTEINTLKNLKITSKIFINIPLDLKLLESLTYTGNFDLSKCNFPKLKQITIHQVAANNLDRDDENYGIDYKLEKPCCPINLFNFDSLTMIRIYNSQIENINEITFPKNIRKLSLNNCSQLKHLDGLKNIPKLEELNISFCNNITDFNFLSELINVKWNIRYMGRVYTNKEFNLLINQPAKEYFYVDGYSNETGDSTFYNFHNSVIQNVKIVFAKYHQKILTEKPSRKEFLDLINPLITELDNLCSKETCSIYWNDEESDILIDYLLDMAQIAGHEFEDSHFYRRFEN